MAVTRPPIMTPPPASDEWCLPIFLLSHSVGASAIAFLSSSSDNGADGGSAMVFSESRDRDLRFGGPGSVMKADPSVRACRIENNAERVKKASKNLQPIMCSTKCQYCEMNWVCAFLFISCEHECRFGTILNWAVKSTSGHLFIGGGVGVGKVFSFKKHVWLEIQVKLHSSFDNLAWGIDWSFHILV